jgi:hypothetical protein
MRHPKRRLSIIAYFASVVLCLLFSLTNAATREFVVAAALLQDRLDLASLECVSIRSARIFGQSYVSEVIKLVEGKLAASVMPEAQGYCPFIFYSNALHQTTRAVKHYGRAG